MLGFSSGIGRIFLCLSQTQQAPRRRVAPRPSLEASRKGVTAKSMKGVDPKLCIQFSRGCTGLWSGTVTARVLIALYLQQAHVGMNGTMLMHFKR